MEQRHIGELLSTAGCWVGFFQVASIIGLLYLFSDYFTFKPHGMTSLDWVAALLVVVAICTFYCLEMASRAARRHQTDKEPAK